MYAGVSPTLSAIRKEFWIPQGRSTVKKVLLNCRACKRHQGGPYRTPQMAPYPRSRIEDSSPFTYTGLDYLGPLRFIARRGKPKQIISDNAPQFKLVKSTVDEA
jgi:hypothetical protein